jgi:hypothetical protein
MKQISTKHSKILPFCYTETVLLKQNSIKKLKNKAEFCQKSNLSIRKLTLSYPTLPRKQNSAKNSEEPAEIW